MYDEATNYFLSRNNYEFFKVEMECDKPETIKIPFSVKGGRKGNPKPKLCRDGEPVDLEKMKDLIEVVINDDVVEIKFKVRLNSIFKFY
ncbi:unnamed protein product [Brugia timori]|uniref:SUI1 domain-containing protein n=1 Tax=Brugia timori TaxID=42155 RepID=A0A0R3RCY5_9BILA|nr:unnamed protein product [Brugia timori]